LKEATTLQTPEPSANVSNWKAAILGIQHLLAMYSGDILVPILIGSMLHFNTVEMTYLVSADIFMCGIATLLQLRTTPLTGIGLPVVLGCAVQAVAPLASIGGKLGITYMYGAIIAAGIFVFLIAGLFARLKYLFPPVVTGSLITIIGFTLVPVGFQNWGGGDLTAKSFGSANNLIIGLVTMIIILGISAFAKGFIKAIAILIGILAGSLLAGAMGVISLAPVAEASWFHLPQFFYFGIPKFNASSMVTMMLVSLTTMIESTGVFFALSDVTGQKISTKDLKKGYRAEGIAAILGGLFNTFPYSTFSQNVGVLKLSGVKTRKPVYFAAFFLIVLGLLPKIGALATIIPSAVLGGAMIVMFGMVGVQGIQILHKVDFSKNSNLLIASMSIGLGIGVNTYPQIFQHLSTELQIMLSNGVVVGSVTAVILNLILNRKELKDQEF